ncbi:hypothetical protein BDN70DRAFT_605389 [Pholiota conissans]|uniref:Uncharacterized protein n=1 Tax=Pholiota conissans TaxID=109636 RepID=A0A9P6CRF6_9AGAR|nr:hypothetical protein BDN70DRAFT_605389 [Pholiota conissans]
MGDTTDGGAIQGIYHIDTISSDVSAKDCSPLDLVRLLFDMLEYNRPIRAVHTSSGMKVELAVCGKTTHARVDMTIAQMAPGMQVDELLVLLLQEDKRNREWEAERDGDDAEACLIASAIGAFQKYNRKREKLGYALLEHRLFPGIVILGSSPVFYKIDVTRELAEAVKRGVCPSTTTVVERHVPAVPRPEKRDEEGMKPLDNRRIMLGCYQAMKKFISWD